MRIWYSCYRCMSSASSTKQAAIDELTAQIDALETDVKAKLAKGRVLQTKFATKHDSAIVKDLRKKLDTLQ